MKEISILQICNKYLTVGGVEYVAECFQKILGGDIVAFQPNEKVKFLLFDRNKPELSPKKALNIKNQYLPLNPIFLKLLIKDPEICQDSSNK